MKTTTPYRTIALVIALVMALSEHSSATDVKSASIVRVGDKLVLNFEDMAKLQALVLDKSGKPRAGKTLTLFLDGHAMKLEPFVRDPHKKQLRFMLLRNEANAAQWRALLDGTSKDLPKVFARVGLADEPEKAIAPINPEVQLKFYADDTWRAGSFAIIIVTGVGLFLLGWKTNLVRDRVAPEEGTNSSPPFSLGRVQMAWWTFIITGTYLYLWGVFGESDSLNATALTLLGISLGTGVAARTIDATKSREIASRLDLLLIRKADLEAKERTTVETEELNRVSARLASARQSEGFWKDILSDEHGVSLPRFQMALWTVILTAVFLLDLWKTESMPTFNDTLLGMLGISSGAYLGFKMPEKPDSTPGSAPLPPDRKTKAPDPNTPLSPPKRERDDDALET